MQSFRQLPQRRKQPVAQIVKKYLNEIKGAEQSTVIGLGINTSCVEAAFANGVVGHCLDYDDLIKPKGRSGGYFTATTFPAALAITEKENNTGKELIEAYILGYEVACRINSALDPKYYLAGYHPTASSGIFGAVIAASKLLGLNCEEITYALGITGSEASGLKENFGTMTKPFHAGQAGAKGVKAALLAKLGFTSSKTIFEGRYGFCNVSSKNQNVDAITKNIGQPFYIPGVTLKSYPCCGGSHSAMYATLKLMELCNVSVEDIWEIEVKCSPRVPKTLFYENPKTALEGKFSMQFPLALSERRVTLQQFTDEKIREPTITTLMQRVKLTPKPELLESCMTGELVTTSRPAIVQIKLKDGRQFIGRCDFALGTPQKPLSKEELLGKYRNCARLVLPEKETEESIELIMNLERIDKIGKLINLVTTNQCFQGT